MFTAIAGRNMTSMKNIVAILLITVQVLFLLVWCCRALFYNHLLNILFFDCVCFDLSLKNDGVKQNSVLYLVKHLRDKDSFVFFLKLFAFKT